MSTHMYAKMMLNGVVYCFNVQCLMILHGVLPQCTMSYTELMLNGLLSQFTIF